MMFIVNSRYILELNGTPSISSTNNSVVNISDVAGSGSNVAVDLSALGTVGVGSIAKCEFDAVEFPYGSDDVPNVLHPEGNINSGFGCQVGQYGNYRDEFINHFGNSSKLNHSNTSAVYTLDLITGRNYCAFTITGE